MELTITELISLLFTFMLCFICIMVIRIRSIISWSILLSVFSTIIIGFYTVSNAVDVAITEIAVGMGISTILNLIVAKETAHIEKKTNIIKPVPLIITIALGLLWFDLSSDMPLFGLASNPTYTHVASEYIKNSEADTGVPNMVTAILASYRGYDTMGETTVIFTAAIGIIALLSSVYDGYPHKPKRKDKVFASRKDPIMKNATALFIPLMLLYAFYIQFHGDYGPGGGFQAGVIGAGAFILYTFLYGTKKASQIITQKLLLYFLSIGMLLYVGTGAVTLLLGKFFDYSLLIPEHPVHGQELGIIVVEAGVGLVVFAAMITIFIYFFSPVLRQQKTINHDVAIQNVIEQELRLDKNSRKPLNFEKILLIKDKQIIQKSYLNNDDDTQNKERI